MENHRVRGDLSPSSPVEQTIAILGAGINTEQNRRGGATTEITFRVILEARVAQATKRVDVGQRRRVTPRFFERRGERQGDAGKAVADVDIPEHDVAPITGRQTRLRKRRSRAFAQHTNEALNATVLRTGTRSGELLSDTEILEALGEDSRGVLSSLIGAQDKKRRSGTLFEASFVLLKEAQLRVCGLSRGESNFNPRSRVAKKNLGIQIAPI